jgi:hypothetical protein
MTAPEKPLNMTEDEVRATQRGEKTQIRVKLRNQPHESPVGSGRWSVWKTWNTRETNGRRRSETNLTTGKTTTTDYRLDVCDWLLEFCPYKVGQRLWVRETWAMCCDLPKTDLEKLRHYLMYRASYPACDWDEAWDDVWHNYRPGWRSSQTMPRWASRLSLEVTAVRVERLKFVSSADPEECFKGDFVYVIDFKPLATTRSGEAEEIQAKGTVTR